MRYETPHALRAALEERLKTESREGSASLNVLRRQVIYIEADSFDAAVTQVRTWWDRNLGRKPWHHEG